MLRSSFAVAGAGQQFCFVGFPGNSEFDFLSPRYQVSSAVFRERKFSVVIHRWQNKRSLSVLVPPVVT